MPSPSWPAVVVSAAVVGGILGAVQPADDGRVGPGEQPRPTAQAAAPAERPRSTTTRVPASPAAEPPPPSDPTWPPDVRSTMPAGAGSAVALTFDDGPHPQWTPLVLDELARHQVRATFCLVGAQVPGNETIVARIHAEGHVLCNHTRTHDYGLAARGRQVIEDEIAQTTAAIQQAAPGAEVVVFRAPGGRFSPDVVAAGAQQGLTSWAWSVDPQDWLHTEPEPIVTGVLDGVAPGAVVLLHDGGGRRAATVQALAEIVPLLQSVGYEFVGLPED